VIRCRKELLKCANFELSVNKRYVKFLSCSSLTPDVKLEIVDAVSGVFMEGGKVGLNHTVKEDRIVEPKENEYLILVQNIRAVK